MKVSQGQVTSNLANERPPHSSPEWKKTHLILIRHGLSEHNRAAQIVNEDGTTSYNFRYNSNPEHPNYRPSNLLEEGRVKLVETAKKLHSLGVQAINTIAYVSPLPRTQQSAEILIQHEVIREAYTTDNRIIEAQAGELEGEFGLYPEISREEKNEKKYESKRVKEFVLTLQDSLSKTDTKNVVIVSHDGVLARMVQLFDPSAEVAMTPGSYLEYDLSFNPTTPKELGKLTLSK